MQLSQSSTFKLYQSIVKIFLNAIERNFYSLRSTNTEILDIFSSGTINHCMEWMKSFYNGYCLNLLISG